MSTIRIAVIGTGGMANSHARSFLEDKEVQLAACCDVVEEKAKEFAVRHGIPVFYSDYRKLLAKEELDAVSIVTNDSAHSEVAVAALKKGLHVLCEKPMATSLPEARKMLAAARASGKMHMINFSYRAFTALERARQIIAAGDLGNIRHVEASYLQSWLSVAGGEGWRTTTGLQWRLSKRHGGGSLADIGCHIMDLATYAVGEVKEITCRMKSFDKGVAGNAWNGYRLDADDSFFATMEFKSGALGVVHGTRWAAGHGNALRLRVFGDKGSLALDSETAEDRLQVCIGEFAARNSVWGSLPANMVKESVYHRFLRSIRTGRPESPTFEEGMRVQSYLDACRASAASGRPVKVKIE